MDNTKGETSSVGGKQNGAPDSSSSSKKSKKPKYSKFTQQELPACKPILTPGWVISSFIFVGVVFIPIGLVALFASEQVVELADHYDKACVPSNYTDNPLSYIKSNETNKTCTRTLTVPKQ